jgi:crossover junction endodeoxyribonuclease RusA
MNDMLRQEQEVQAPAGAWDGMNKTPNALQIALPFPVSVNNLFLNVRGRGRIPSPAYRQWREDAGWALKAQKPPRIPGPIEIAVDLTPPDKRARDIDNLFKGILDLLVTHGIIDGDDSRTVRRVSAEWVNGDPCTVTIRKAA